MRPRLIPYPALLPRCFEWRRAMRSGLMRLCLAVPLALVSSPAMANCAFLSFCSCSTSTSGLSFGTYDPFATLPDDATATVTVNCALFAAWPGSVDISLSKGSSGNFAQRTLKNGATTLNYNVYTTSSRNQVLGDGSGGTLPITINFAGILNLAQNLTLYGRIPAQQNVRVGTYTDTLIVTITY
jgi:spore coat protein U-like protein